MCPKIFSHKCMCRIDVTCCGAQPLTSKDERCVCTSSHSAEMKPKPSWRWQLPSCSIGIVWRLDCRDWEVESAPDGAAPPSSATMQALCASWSGRDLMNSLTSHQIFVSPFHWELPKPNSNSIKRLSADGEKKTLEVIEHVTVWWLTHRLPLTFKTTAQSLVLVSFRFGFSLLLPSCGDLSIYRDYASSSGP